MNTTGYIPGTVMDTTGYIPGYIPELVYPWLYPWLYSRVGISWYMSLLPCPVLYLPMYTSPITTLGTLLSSPCLPEVYRQPC